MNTPINEAVEREAFEREMRKKYGEEHFIRRQTAFDGLCYSSTTMQGAWAGWQARAALPPPIVEPVAWEHSLFDESGNHITTKCTQWEDSPFGSPGIDHSAEFTVESLALVYKDTDGAADARVLDPVVEANRKLLHQRSQVGIKKYGVTLGDANLSEPELLQHALEEVLDLGNYIQALLMRKTPSPEWEALMQKQDTAIASTHTTTGGEK